MRCFFATTEGEPLATTFEVSNAGEFGLILFALWAEVAASLLTASRTQGPNGCCRSSHIKDKDLDPEPPLFAAHRRTKWLMRPKFSS